MSRGLELELGLAIAGSKHPRRHFPAEILVVYAEGLRKVGLPEA
jgi:hypothetical protein